MKENCSDRVHILQMDVTNREQVQKCVSYVKENLPKGGMVFKAKQFNLNQRIF